MAKLLAYVCIATGVLAEGVLLLSVIAGTISLVAFGVTTCGMLLLLFAIGWRRRVEARGGFHHLPQMVRYWYAFGLVSIVIVGFNAMVAGLVLWLAAQSGHRLTPFEQYFVLTVLAGCMLVVIAITGLALLLWTYLRHRPVRPMVHRRLALELPVGPTVARAAAPTAPEIAPPLDLDRCLYRGHGDSIDALAWSPDGERIASSSRDGAIHIWQAATADHLLTCAEHPPQRLLALAWSPDGQRLAATCGQLVRIWADGSIELTCDRHERLYEPVRFTPSIKWVRSLCWSPDGRYLASWSSDPSLIVGNLLLVWLAATGETVFEYRYRLPASRAFIAWSPDGSRLALAQYRQICTWDTTTWDAVAIDEFEQGGIHAAAWSRDWRYLALEDDQGMHVLDRASRAEVAACVGHTEPVNALAWSPDSRHLASGSQDETVRVWDASNGEALLTYRGHSGPVNALCWSPDGTRIASADGRTVRVWRVP
jgi:dipeptidyl aminopeptidase/acylaminoacyl peptidase